MEKEIEDGGWRIEDTLCVGQVFTLRRQSVYALDAYSSVLQIAVAAVSYCPGASHCPDISPTLLAAHKIHIYGLILFSVIAMATYYGNPPLVVAVWLASDRLFARLCIA